MTQNKYHIIAIIIIVVIISDCDMSFLGSICSLLLHWLFYYIVFFYLGIEASQVMGFPEKITFAVVLLCVKPFISIILLLTTALRKRNGYH